MLEAKWSEIAGLLLLFLPVVVLMIPELRKRKKRQK